MKRLSEVKEEKCERFAYCEYSVKKDRKSAAEKNFSWHPMPCGDDIDPLLDWRLADAKDRKIQPQCANKPHTIDRGKPH